MHTQKGMDRVMGNLQGRAIWNEIAFGMGVILRAFLFHRDPGGTTGIFGMSLFLASRVARKTWTKSWSLKLQVRHHRPLAAGLGQRAAKSMQFRKFRA
jgi:hypothetical protein